MKIGINSRIYQNNETGIPYFIKYLYKTLLNKHKKFEYLFLQTSAKKTIGLTQLYLMPNTTFGAFLFDVFFSNQLAIKEKVDIFHGPSNVLPLFKRDCIKYVVTIHDLSFLIFPDYYPKLFNFYYRFIINNTLKNADIVVADSYNTKRDILRFYKISENKIKVVHLGVNERYLNAPITPRLIVEKYFFSICTHTHRKNILSVLEAITKIQQLREYKYIIAGLITNKQLQELKDRIYQLNLKENVILFNYVSEEHLISLYQNAEFFIYPSFYEGFGFPVLEAMASKCPVIASNNSSFLEITPNKKWLVNPYKPREIANKMRDIINLSKNKRTELIEKNYLFSKKFTWQKTAKKYFDIFNNL